MLFEFSLAPLGSGCHLSGEIAKALKIVEDSGLPYKLTPGSTCLEGSWDEVMPVIRLCHNRMRENSEHVITTIKIEDERDGFRKLDSNIQSVEKKLGHTLEKVI